MANKIAPSPAPTSQTAWGSNDVHDARSHPILDATDEVDEPAALLQDNAESEQVVAFPGVIDSPTAAQEPQRPLKASLNAGPQEPTATPLAAASLLMENVPGAKQNSVENRMQDIPGPMQEQTEPAEYPIEVGDSNAAALTTSTRGAPVAQAPVASFTLETLGGTTDVPEVAQGALRVQEMGAKGEEKVDAAKGALRAQETGTKGEEKGDGSLGAQPRQASVVNLLQQSVGPAQEKVLKEKPKEQTQINIPIVPQPAATPQATQPASFSPFAKLMNLFSKEPPKPQPEPEPEPADPKEPKINESELLGSDNTWTGSKVLEIRETEYVPLSLARKKVQEVLVDMQRMRTEHLLIIQEMEEAWNNRNTIVEEKVAEIKKKKAIIRQAQQKIRVLNKAVEQKKEMEELIEKLSQDIAAQKVKFDEITQQNIAKWNNELQEHDEKLNDEIDSLKLELSNVKATERQLQQSIDDMKSTHQLELEKQAKEIAEDAEAKALNSEEVKQRERDLLATITGLEDKMQNVMESKDKTIAEQAVESESQKEEIKKLKKALKKLSKQLDEANQKVQTDESEKVKLQEEFKSKAVDEEHLSARLKEHEAEKSTLAEVNAKLTKDYDELLEKYNKLTSDFNTQKEELEKVQEELKKAKKAVNKCAKKLKEVEDDNTKLLDKMKQDESQRDALASEEMKKTQEQHTQLREQIIRLEKMWKEETELRKKLFNQIQEMKGKIRVMARCLPPKEDGLSDKFVFSDCYTLKVSDKEFLFDKIFGPEASQEDVFKDVKYSAQLAVDGFNSCVFVYGQSGTGKTFTIYGPNNKPGIGPRLFSEMFKLLEKASETVTFKVQSYMIELNGDQLYDLYYDGKGRKPPQLEIKKDPRGVVFILNTSLVPAMDTKQLMKNYEEGLQRRLDRPKAAMQRSHIMFTVLVETKNKLTGATTSGKLTLFDLAGTEDISKLQTDDPDWIKECKAVNKTMTDVGLVIQALSVGEANVPYRNNKLTLLMMDALGGNAKTLMLVCFSGTEKNMDETVKALSYGTRAKLITNQPVNTTPLPAEPSPRDQAVPSEKKPALSRSATPTAP